MFTYQTTPLEDWIESLYKQLRIHHPYELDMELIAERLDIWLYFEEMSSRALDRNGMYSMIIDRRLTPAEQWQDFGHETCHLLRQAGNQFLLNHSMVELQETRADSFAYHFCIPTFMLLYTSLPTSRNEAITLVTETFNVTPEFAQERLIRFEKQLLTSQLTNQLAATIEAQKKIKRSIGCEYTIQTANSTMLFCRERGVIGYLK